MASPATSVAITASTPSSTMITANQRGRTRDTTSTTGSMSRATTLQATTHPIVRWASTKASASTNAVTTAATTRTAAPGVRPARTMATGRGVSAIPRCWQGRARRLVIPVGRRAGRSSPTSAVACRTWSALQRSDDVVFDTAGDRAVLLDPGGQELITLNPVGTIVWRELDGRRDAAALADDLLPRFTGVGVDELREDIAVFLAELVQLGLAVDAAG